MLLHELATKRTSQPNRLLVSGLPFQRSPGPRRQRDHTLSSSKVAHFQFGNIIGRQCVAICKFFLWLLLRNRQRTSDRRHHGNNEAGTRRENNYLCPLCLRNLETALHRPVHRMPPYARALGWNKAGTWSKSKEPLLKPANYWTKHTHTTILSRYSDMVRF